MKTKNSISYYMSLPYTIVTIKNSNGTFFVKVKELTGCISEGKTFEEAYKMINDAMKEWFSTAIEDKLKIPLPELVESKKHSGKILIRIPIDLHRELAENAKKQGVSLNSYIITLLSKRNAEDTVVRKVAEFVAEHTNMYNDKLNEK